MSKNIFLTKKGLRFIIRAFQDLGGAFTPPITESEPTTGKRILVFNWRDLKHAFAGGAEVYIHELAKQWVKDGNTVTMFCGSDGKSARNEIIDGVNIIRRGGFYFVYVWAFLYYILQFRGNYDVIVDCENGIPFFTPLYARKKIFLVIHHVHQEVFLTSLKWPFSRIALFLEMQLMPLVYRNVQVITVSESSRNEILQHGLTTTNPLVIYNGIDRTRYTPGRKSKTPMILYIGRLKHYKRLDVLLRAMDKISASFPDAELVIGGEGEETRKLKRLTKKLGLTNVVTFTGRLTEEKKVALYRKAWVFVNPSLREGWGITTIEANACGTPVVASDVPGLRDSVRNPHTGFLVPFGKDEAFAEKISLLLRDSALRQSFSRGAKAWAHRFSWEFSARQFLNVMNAPEVALKPAGERAKGLRTAGVSYGEVKTYEE